MFAWAAHPWTATGAEKPWVPIAATAAGQGEPMPPGSPNDLVAGNRAIVADLIRPVEAKTRSPDPRRRAGQDGRRDWSWPATPRTSSTARCRSRSSSGPGIRQHEQSVRSDRHARRSRRSAPHPWSSRGRAPPGVRRWLGGFHEKVEEAINRRPRTMVRTLKGDRGDGERIGGLLSLQNQLSTLFRFGVDGEPSDGRAPSAVPAGHGDGAERRRSRPWWSGTGRWSSASAGGVLRNGTTPRTPSRPPSSCWPARPARSGSRVAGGLAARGGTAGRAAEAEAARRRSPSERGAARGGGTRPPGACPRIGRWSRKRSPGCPRGTGGRWCSATWRA